MLLTLRPLQLINLEQESVVLSNAWYRFLSSSYSINQGQEPVKICCEHLEYYVVLSVKRGGEKMFLTQRNLVT